MGYRPKQLDTVLGPVRLDRAWYHCSDCHAGAAIQTEAHAVLAGAALPRRFRPRWDDIWTRLHHTNAA